MTIFKLAISALAVSASFGATALPVLAAGHGAVGDEVIAEQRAELASATQGKGFGPQSPRDIDAPSGMNHRAFGSAPAYAEMNLCNIHFHENAEHKGGEFTHYAGNGDGHGYGSGYEYNGTLNAAELSPLDHKVGDSEHGDLEPGDTIEIHFVYSTAQVQPGEGLGSCVSEAIANPQLRVEAVVAVLVNDPKAASLTDMAAVKTVEGLYQTGYLPDDLGRPVVYDGSTTGPTYNEKASPFQVTWSVRPQVVKMDIASVDAWLKDNPFKEDHAHGVRNLVMNPDLLSPIVGQ
ncbi:delta-class carbonic anhydrase [Mesobacterium sp. TK19101]|uniref:Delta-class carbonic anhydrase n=1 Tax=Mesobacterium hydrothermale TaxID=3111907 RepID=A0ABU6HFF6_9RHOB|nr:delta-class carbonic anhydrase [Mesobacterium sp. TK19101]MEC3860575.1 delta-class carbonic anhydrase [Mesobacterium sp. TK19101]